MLVNATSIENNENKDGLLVEQGSQDYDELVLYEVNKLKD